MSAVAHRLEQFCPNVTAEFDAAEALARRGGTDGLLAVLENLGRRGDNGDSDYIAYRLTELNATQVVDLFEIADSIGLPPRVR
ncbi:hypothetical protein [Nocardia otitidiscaviarum]|uniref:hypothetical protein n=1 Tax=Nocardia otitidiscaviarum TaxID=1823 RepID=UPI0018959779|nr:hypothetical protein [Nocardia otitidiscaviarum]MBF6181955.1 hypothetical protein [Nocardia otitidiscaviarum]